MIGLRSGPRSTYSRRVLRCHALARLRFVAGLLVLAVGSLPVEAASVKAQCRAACGARVAACEAATAAFGTLGKGCAKSVWKQCARGGLDTCQVSSTITTTTAGTATSTTTTTLDGAAGSARLLQTGQTACSDASGTEISCAGTGHDGDLRTGLERSYVDNGDGTITDTHTGLVWEKLSDDGSIHDTDTFFNWTEAFAKVAALNDVGFAGHADWRMPNVNELRSLASYGLLGPAVSATFHSACASGCSVEQCSCTRSGSYWSSTTYAEQKTRAWFVYFFSGTASVQSKGTGGVGLRAVRGGP